MGVPIGGGGRSRKRGRESARGGSESERLGIMHKALRKQSVCQAAITLILNSSRVAELLAPKKS